MDTVVTFMLSINIFLPIYTFGMWFLEYACIYLKSTHVIWEYVCIKEIDTAVRFMHSINMFLQMRTLGLWVL